LYSFRNILGLALYIVLQRNKRKTVYGEEINAHYPLLV